ncbi:hypothetical protein K503DRAFT_23435 [Rhizopogon vinicolor AM-OR11-026]|uniref:Uncharacterized protein n=1 Tax=Rhizopogon vinicolor AM-OR11-026 TaxID=1314800 RepID=A0A1B7N5J2_9AGAM|nr:hypothetical protein K503DRAFT_23435 [Rhizopogon vinicolor AM-OR11-026]
MEWRLAAAAGHTTSIFDGAVPTAAASCGTATCFYPALGSFTVLWVSKVQYEYKHPQQSKPANEEATRYSEPSRPQGNRPMRKTRVPNQKKTFTLSKIHRSAITPYLTYSARNGMNH